MPTARYDYGIASINDKIYVAGGAHSNALECFDPILGAWTSKASMIKKRQNFALFVWSEKLYAIGFNNDLDQYDPDDDEWITVRINS